MAQSHVSATLHLNMGAILSKRTKERAECGSSKRVAPRALCAGSPSRDGWQLAASHSIIKHQQQCALTGTHRSDHFPEFEMWDSPGLCERRLRGCINQGIAGSTHALPFRTHEASLI